MVIARPSVGAASVDTHKILAEVQELPESTAKLPHQRAGPLATSELRNLHHHQGLRSEQREEAAEQPLGISEVRLKIVVAFSRPEAAVRRAGEEQIKRRKGQR